MPSLIHNDDLKRLFTGAGLAAVAGLLVGAVTEPRLEDRILAPQQDMGRSGARTYEASAAPGVTSYGGVVPDYVVGTRWLQPQPQVVAYQAPPEPEAWDANDYAEPAHATEAQRWREEARDAPLYPSERGSTYYESDLPDPPEDLPDDLPL